MSASAREREECETGAAGVAYGACCCCRLPIPIPSTHLTYISSLASFILLPPSSPAPRPSSRFPPPARTLSSTLLLVVDTDRQGTKSTPRRSQKGHTALITPAPLSATRIARSLQPLFFARSEGRSFRPFPLDRTRGLELESGDESRGENRPSQGDCIRWIHLHVSCAVGVMERGCM
jgi:hypothetical protein